MYRILVIEDDDQVAQSIKKFFPSALYSVAVVNDGVTGLERARSREFDLVILDIELPGRDGFSICKELRREQSSVPIVMLTHLSISIYGAFAYDLGTDQFIGKPFDLTFLLAVVKRLLQPEGVPDIFKFGDITVDLKRAWVLRNGQKVDLTPIEYKLLELFIKPKDRDDRIWTHRELINGAWTDKLTFPEDRRRALDWHILNLRKKLGPFIETVRSKGYRFTGKISNLTDS